MIQVANPNTPEWLAARTTGIGASQAGAACNISRYGGPLDVYYSCIGEKTEDLEGNEHVRFGKFMEPSIVAMYSDEIGKPLTYPLPMCRHEKWPFMLATGDAQEDDRTGVEIKTVDTRYAYESDVINLGLEECFPEYVLQAQQQMAVMNWDLVNVVMLIGKKLHKFPIERDNELIEMIAKHEANLWQNVLQRTPPTPTRPVDLEVLKKRKRIDGGVVALTDEMSKLWDRYERIGKHIKKMEEQRDLIKAKVLHEIGDAPAGVLQNGTHMIRRAVIKKKGFTVAPSEQLDVRKVKYDGSAILVR